MSGLPKEEGRRLLASWLLRLALEEGLPVDTSEVSGVTASGRTVLTVGSTDGLHFTIHPEDGPPWAFVEVSDPAFEEAKARLWRQAAERVQALDFGGNVWYSTVLREPPRNFFTMGGDFMRLVGSQVRIAGWRRLGSRVLLEFGEVESEGADEQSEAPDPPLLAPLARVSVHVFVPAPREGDFASRVASGLTEAAGAGCSFALGRSVGTPLLRPRPSEDDVLAELEARHLDGSVGTLARKGTSLDIFDALPALGGGESQVRAAAALRTFDAAMRQERDDISLVLFVAAAEALSTPFVPWKKNRLTKRFVTFFDELMPEELDALVAHANTEAAFGFQRGARSAKALRKELLDVMYSLRSAPIHEGLGAALGRGVFGPFDDVGHLMRRALCADFAEDAILRFVQSPRTSLIGHPDIPW